MKRLKGKTKDFVLEIGTEELPSGYIEGAMAQLRRSAEAALKNSRLNFTSLDLFGTPNRLVVYIKDLSPRQEVKREKIIGPSKEMAFDKEGKPTQACLGFLRSKKAELKDISIESTPRGEYVFIERHKESLPSKKVLTEILPPLVESLKFPKVMRWDASALNFARPIRGILALYGSETIGFKVGGLTAGGFTALPRYLSYGLQPVKVKSSKDYFNKLKSFKVIIDQRAREEKILGMLKSSARKLGAASDFSKDLINTVNYLVESPSAFAGKFRKEYLNLPVEVLENSMAKNQKIFLLKDKNGKALAYFVAIINGAHKDADTIRRTFEAILDAKLKDSVFFLEEDLKSGLQNRSEALKGVVFQTKLGTMYDRIQRIEKLSLYIAGILNIPEQDKKKIQRGAQLSKADLTTLMVKEFPDLQGVVGREYARLAGEDKEVAKAIYEHYLPKGIADPLPTTNISSVLAIADKTDAITGFFGIGLIPTGSEDPYGIRRASLGLLKILLEKKYPLSLDGLIDKSFELYGNIVGPDKAPIKAQILSFQKERLKNILLDKNYKDDIIDAVLCTGSGRFDHIIKKISDLSSISQAKYFLEAAKVIERISNILKLNKQIEETSVKIKPEVFREPLEKELWDIYEKNKGKIEEKISACDYIGATKLYAETFFNPIHLFFEKVVVNIDDQAIRINRVALLKAVQSLYAGRVADLSKIKLQ